MNESQIFKTIQTDMRAAVARDLRIDFNRYGIELGPDEKTWVQDEDNCSVCAIGAVLLGTAKPDDIATYDKDVQFALEFGQPKDWGTGFFNGSCITQGEEEMELAKLEETESADFLRGFKLALRVRDWAQSNLPDVKL